ncbi:hypothetical protein C8F01DRAFT_1133801 [Mycena amicta]|nr:hypothetical protein C8F01DRAFT_1133801 [Mycena amicta]
MAGLAPTPVISRPRSSAQILPYQPIQTNFCFSDPDLNYDARRPPDAFSDSPPTSEYSSFRSPTAEDVTDLDVPGYMRVSAPSPEEKRNANSSSFSSPPSFARWSATSRTASLEVIEEDELEDYPPISSSPSRSSDSFFPPDASNSSPQTSEPDDSSPITPTNVDDALTFKTMPETTDDFASQLHGRLIYLTNQKPSRTLDEHRSYSVTPDYPRVGSPNPNSFGPLPQSTSSFSANLNLCQCRECAGSAYSPPSSTAGYEADSETPSNLPSNLFSTRNLRSSNCATPSQSSPHPIPQPASAKRTYSSFNKHSNASPVVKKLKLSSSRSFSRSTGSENRAALSELPASLRKSLSLRSDTAAAPTKVLSPTSPGELVPTEPNTPRPIQRKTTTRHVPIIAPPPEHVARLPVTEEVAAKIRIGNFLSREGRSRAADKLEGINVLDAIRRLNAEPEKTEWEAKLGIGSSRRQVSKWFLEVMPSKSTYTASITTASGHPVISRASSFASVSSRTSDDDMIPDLMDQLQTSPETRFHAAYLFLRYFYILMGDQKERERIEALQAAAIREDSEEDLPEVPSESWRLLLWDIAIACLAISTKFHRDFVLSWEFVYLAPHDMLFEDVETAQRDVLSGISYRVGDSPQLLLDELWTALPSLRELLHFDGGWNYVQKETWSKLFNAILEPDILKFPPSHLTAAALIEGIISTLILKKEYDAPLRGPRRNKVELVKFADKARVEVVGVVQDIQAMLGISDAMLRVVRRWILQYC